MGNFVNYKYPLYNTPARTDFFHMSHKFLLFFIHSIIDIFETNKYLLRFT
jgi:hypothetical protein